MNLPALGVEARRKGDGAVALLRFDLSGGRHLQFVGETSRRLLSWIRDPSPTPSLALSAVLDASEYVDLYLDRLPSGVALRDRRSALTFSFDADLVRLLGALQIGGDSGS